MKIYMKVLFTSKQSDRLHVDQIFKSNGVNQTPSDSLPRYASQMNSLDYQVDILYNPDVFARISQELRAIGILNVTCSYRFEYEEKDYHEAPFFLISGIGNNPDVYLEDQGAEFETEIVCDNCRLYRKKVVSPLVIDTSYLEEYDMVHVDHEHFVISERLLSRFKDWGIEGYETHPVLHKGSDEDRQPAYQLVPSQQLSPWSAKNPKLEFVGARKCPRCDRRGYLEYPVYYEDSLLQGQFGDFVSTQEEVVAGNRLIRLPLLSSQLRDRLIAEGITSDVRAPEQYGERDWKLDPIVVVSSVQKKTHFD
ncbi:hypothetical protein [Tumebacillus permanentifrigoris]|uniref:Uncharacterized protein n=1 Tax=Tumebacillus permanentifrigoris TaxID=378543 RepID=A0A316D4P8_9BACL|nr:hypothetical protein [Tumebacillus permanentifrigoris]PWK07443.1 hypothetical protein C7459_11741 [Tumebacillus permanentifrigoris]